MAKRGIRIKATGKRNPVKPKLSSNRGGIFTAKLATIQRKRKSNNG